MVRSLDARLIIVKNVKKYDAEGGLYNQLDKGGHFAAWEQPDSS
jgi:hypothetical protein